MMPWHVVPNYLVIHLVRDIMNTISIKIIQSGGQSSLVEWYDPDRGMLRAYVPTPELSNGKCSRDVLDAGIPYGIPWSEIVSVFLSPETIQRELRRIGIWDEDDLLKKASQVIGAVNRATGINFATLKNAVTNFKKKEV